MMTTHGKGHGQRPAFGAGIGKKPCRQMTFIWFGPAGRGEVFPQGKYSISYGRDTRQGSLSTG